MAVVGPNSNSDNPKQEEEEEEESVNGNRNTKDKVVMKAEETDLGNGSDVVYVPRFLSYEKSWEYFNYLDQNIPWTRPTIHVFSKPFLQPRDVCYIASEGLKDLTYSGYTPRAYSWDDFPPVKEILDQVHKAFPGGHFNSLLLNRYNSGNDYVGWHADDEKLYGPHPEIASISFGCERDFFLKKRSNKKAQAEVEGEPSSKRAKKNNDVERYSFKLKHGSLLLMRGNTQRDWLHSVPKRAKAESARINLTFRNLGLKVLNNPKLLDSSSYQMIMTYDIRPLLMVTYGGITLDGFQLEYRRCWRINLVGIGVFAP